MALSRQLLQTAMNRLLSKLNTLLMPRLEHQGCRLGPLAAEIRASAELMRWFASELPEARAMLADEMVAQHRNWPNVMDWRNFVRAIESLTVDLDTEAIGDFDEARDLLLEECRQMLSVAPGAAAPGKASQGTFLPTDSQRRVYRELVLTYYREYIVGKDLKHKELMLHWAAVYQAIADRTGLRDVPFCGPEFDAFVYDYCGIAYNVSNTRRGRYRSVQDLWARCMNVQEYCPQRQDFSHLRSQMIQIIGSQQRVVERHGSDVPRRLPNG